MSVSKKICMVGSFGVGKTSLVSRFVHSVFSETYQTTVGVKVDRTTVSYRGQPVTLILWDLAGEDEFNTIRPSYLRGSAGYLLVADGTRSDTVETARAVDARAIETLGDVPRVVALNKADRVRDWEVDLESVAISFAGPVIKTSAKSGDGVEEAFRVLTDEIMRRTP